MNTRSTLGGGTLLGLALLFIGLTILFNHALRGWRLDLTQNRLYTTAVGTDRILASIKEPINLYFFFSAKTAAQLPQLKTYGVPGAARPQGPAHPPARVFIIPDTRPRLMGRQIKPISGSNSTPPP